ncbi:tryptophan-rich sensory protein [Galbibacter sp. BG1]|uniref:tryptophan-rich sensory protein n=1 Tax=Galbibacter sp. BG1 TaxID=1170699 RepID=UPI0015B85AA7|nr:tryptophan-rich sensory protein [Galbibacter sp. BG1]QLE02692.1 tryptophan-rich sensory protein [Galbibacter sp. BG1]
MEAGKKIVKRITNRWKLFSWLEIMLLAFGPTFLIFLITRNILAAIGTFLGFLLLGYLFKKPWKITEHSLSKYLDLKWQIFQDSTALLLIPSEDLSKVAVIQKQRVEKILNEHQKQIKYNGNIGYSILFCLVFVLVGFIFNKTNLLNAKNDISSKEEVEKNIEFQPTDSLQKSINPPEIVSQTVTVRFPEYTRRKSYRTQNMNIKVLKGSRVFWKLEFNNQVKSVLKENNGNKIDLDFTNGMYETSAIVAHSGFYNFRFIDTLGNTYSSKLYSLETFEDEKPVIKMEGLPHFTTFDFDGAKKISFKTIITDDYGLTNPQIIATVSKGSGESVKFREEKLSFDSNFRNGSKEVSLLKTIDLDLLDMKPGDELYFYVEVFDEKTPKPNVSRSETFFAVIKDTINNSFAVEGGMGVDLMPDYFRSQRQLIIDTEALIKQKPTLSIEKYKSESNILGYEQKMLRLKYGQFMGDENEGEMQPAESVNMEDEVSDPTDGYRHDHDHENEHNLVDEDHHDHGHEPNEEEGEDPLEAYLHNHDDPEESTLFTQSLKSKLRQAINEMWDAELHLRMGAPKKSLPYQYNALKLIQEIKNSARIYVHRIGFDPPPIKEDKRLSGELDKIKSFYEMEDFENPENYVFMRKAIAVLENRLKNGVSLTEEDREVLEQAANELAQFAIDNPSNYLTTLQILKKTIDNNSVTKNDLIQLQNGLLKAVPDVVLRPSLKKENVNDINELMLKELSIK